MSRLRRLVLSDRYFFITGRVLPHRRMLDEAEFECLARVICERRRKHGFLLTAWVFLPDHWHAILYPPHPLTISRVMESIKVGSTLRINGARRERGLFWQPRFFDRAMHTVKEYHEKAEYIHRNPVEAGLVSRAEDWWWSSAREYLSTVSAPVSPHLFLAMDRVLLPDDERTRI